MQALGAGRAGAGRWACWCWALGVLALGAGCAGAGRRGGNQAGRAELGWANNGPGQNRAGLKLARFFRAKILTAQLALKTGPVRPNSLLKEKKNSGGPGHTGLSHIGPGQIWPDFFLANNLMAQPGPNFGRTGLAHRVGPILPPIAGRAGRARGACGADGWARRARGGSDTA